MTSSRASASPRASAHAGFTLVELLVVIAIIGVLVGLLLPAIQAARESGRRISCGNNLHQVGIGLIAYQSAHGEFPPGGIEPRIYWRDKKSRQIAWSAFLLPYIEEGPLYDRIDFTKAFDSPENAAAAATVVTTYVCPSVPHKSNVVDGFGVSDYGGIYGERILSNNTPPRGAMIYDRPMRIVDIPDGTASTLMISEDGDWPDGQWINARNVFDQAYAINYKPPAGQPPENEIRSKHPRGANGLFCDGSARFLNEDMTLDTLAAICTRNGGEAAPSF